MTFVDSDIDQAMNMLDDQEAEDRQIARTRILEATANKPDRAAKAIEIGKDLDTPPEIVSQDYDQYEPQHKATKNSQYVDSKPHLTDFINSHPMAAAIAQDDYEDLDHWHDTLQLLYHATTEVTWDRLQSAFGEVVQGFGQIFSAIPKQVALVSRTTAEARKEGLDRQADTGDYDIESPEERAAYRQRRGVVRPSLETLGEKRQILDEATSRPVEEDPFYEAGTAIDEFLKYLTPTNPDYKDEFLTSTLPGAIGSMVGFVAGGALFKMLKVGEQGLVPMPFAVATLGAVSQSTDQFEDAIKNGASIEDALTSSGWGALIGTSEALPIVHFLDRLDKSSGGTVKHALVNILKQGAEEGIQSFGQRVGSNVVANQIVGYDPDRGTFAGSMDDATVGFAAGALMQTLASLITGKRGRIGAAKEASDRVKAISAYLEAGEVPPPGVDSFVDAAHILAAKEDFKKLQEAGKAADKTQTKELAPDLAEDFAQRGSNEMKIGIAVDAVDALYSGEEPMEGDNKLGFIPNLAEQLTTARQSGMDIQVSLAMLLAHATPEVREQLEEHVRVRENGMTFAQAKEFEETHKNADKEIESIPKPVTPEDLARREGGFDILAQRIRTQVTLKKSHTFPSPHYPEDPDFTHFHIMNEEGKRIGDAQVQMLQNGVLYVGWLGGYKPGARGVNRQRGQPLAFGLHAVESFFEQLVAEYPETKTIGGYRVSGARDKSGHTGDWAEISADRFRKNPKEGAEFLAQIQGWDKVETASEEEPELPGTQTTTLPNGGTIKWQPQELWSEKKAEVWDAINKIAEQIVPGANLILADKIITQGSGMSKPGKVGGFFSKGEFSGEPYIVVAYSEHGSIGTLLHEVIHHLRRGGFFSQGEWEILEKAAKDEGWIEKYSIVQRYPNADKYLMLEEAIAEGYRDWVKKEGQTEGKSAKEIAGIFDKLKEFFTKIKAMVQEIYGADVTFDRLFTEISTGEIGQRKPQQVDKFAFSKSFGQVFAEATEAEETQMFERGAALGMTQTSFKRWMKKVDEQRASLQARAERRAQKMAKISESEEWKQNSGKVFQEVTNSVNSQGNILADDYFRRGMVGDKKVKTEKIASAALTEDQKKVLGKHFYYKDGLDPDQFAPVFGFPNGETMIDALIQLQTDRGKLTGKAYKNKLIAEQFKSEMMKRYGNPEKDAALQEARSDVVSDTLMDQLHEELLAAAFKAKATDPAMAPPFTKASIKQSVKAAFATIPVERAKNMEGFFKDAGRAAQKIEEAMINENWTEALRQKQRQILSVGYALESKALNKKIDQNERLVERFRSREVFGVAQEYTNQIHEVLRQLGEKVMRTQADLTKALDGVSLQRFVDGKNANLFELNVPDFLFSSTYNTPFEKMPVKDFLAVAEGLRQLAAAGRLETKVEKSGIQADFKAVEDLMVQSLETFSEAKPIPLGRGNTTLTGQPKGWLKKFARTTIAIHLTFETFMNRWDRFDPHGPFNQYIALPLAAAANHFNALERKYAKKVLELKDKTNLNEEVKNTLFIDSLTGDFFKMTRRHLRAVMNNIGNRSNLLKLAEGYDLDPIQIRNWVHATATKEDWDHAQRLGDVFKEIKDDADRMYERLTGGAPESIELEPIQTQFGEYAGWYHPLIRDKLRSPLTKEERDSMVHGVQQEEYFRATTPNGYTKKRTAVRYRLNLDEGLMVGRMRQMLYDIAMREAVIQAGKFFSSERLRQKISQRAEFGPEIVAQMRSYLEDVANVANVDSEAASVGAHALDFFRQNAVTGLIGVNPGTVLKHGPTAGIQSLQEGGLPFLNEYAYSVKNLFTRLPQGGLNWKFAMETSEELQRRERHVRDTVGGGYQGALGEEGLRKTIQNIGSFPVSKSDLASAVPLWLTVYRQEMEEHGVKGEAIEMADRAVRRAHGSTTIVNQPDIMRKAGALGRMFTSVYGFMNHMTNRNAELIWRIQDLYKGDYKQAAPVVGAITKNVAQLGIKHAGKAVAAGIFAYVIWPALVEALASPMPHGDDDSVWGIVGKDLAKYILSLGIGTREIAGWLATGGNPSVGLVGTMVRNVSDVVKDIDDVLIKDKAKAQKMFKDSMLTIAIFTGLTFAQVGRTGQFVFNYLNGEDRPSKFGNFWMTEEDSFLRGLRYGESTPKRQRR